MTEPTTIPGLNTKVDEHGNTVPITHADLPAAPGIANPKHTNAVVGFFKKVWHIVDDVFIWAPKVAGKTVEVIEESEQLTPEFVKELGTIIEDVALVAEAVAVAASSKGANVGLDLTVIQRVEKLAADFTTFYPVVVKDFQALEAIIVKPEPVPVPVPAPTPAPIPDTTLPPVGGVPAFTPKTPVVNSSEQK